MKLTVSPIDSASVLKEFQECFAAILDKQKRALQKHTIIRMNIFINVKTVIGFKRIKNKIISVMHKYFQQIPFLYIIIPQPPADKFKVKIEVTLKDSDDIDTFEKYGNADMCYYVCTNKKYNEVHGAIFGIDKGYDTLADSNFCFHIIRDALRFNGMDLSDVIRQWAYIGNINEQLPEYYGKTDNYQQFNKSRALWYKDFNWKNGYPSATGIGMEVPGIIIEFTAIRSTEVKIKSVNNPQQIDAHKYSDKYISAGGSLNSPKFERAKTLNINGKYIVYISGTAAIIGEDSVGADVVQQTKITLDNIEKLRNEINKENKTDLVCTSARVYLKNRKDLKKAEPLCRDYFGAIPVVYVKADVCREELEIEIEADINT